MNNQVNANDVAITEFYRAWIVRILSDEESDKMARAMQELNESARAGDPIPSAAELMTATSAERLLDLIAETTGDNRADLAYLEENQGQ